MIRTRVTSKCNHPTTGDPVTRDLLDTRGSGRRRLLVTAVVSAKNFGHDNLTPSRGLTVDTNDLAFTSCRASTLFDPTRS
jgi:hypothetical protein